MKAIRSFGLLAFRCWDAGLLQGLGRSFEVVRLILVLKLKLELIGVSGNFKS